MGETLQVSGSRVTYAAAGSCRRVSYHGLKNFSKSLTAGSNGASECGGQKRLRRMRVADFTSPPHPVIPLSWTPASLLLKLVDFFRGLSLGKIVLHFLSCLLSQRVQVGTLRSGHWLTPGRPLIGVLLHVSL